MKYTHEDGTPFSKKEFLQKLKTDKEFNEEFGSKGIDQIANLINDLKTNPDSRRMVVSAWAVHDLPKMTLPPCHYGFQVYTRELSGEERWDLLKKNVGKELFDSWVSEIVPFGGGLSEYLQSYNIPTRAISLMWNQRSVDTFLGLPFNIASYGLLLEIIAKAVNMVPDELIGNLGDTHLYSNHIEQAKEQIGRELTLDERNELLNKVTNREHKRENCFSDEEFDRETLQDCKAFNIPTRTREPFPLPKLHINDEFWNPDADLLSNLPNIQLSDFYVDNYQSHPTIKAPLSN